MKKLILATMILTSSQISSAEDAVYGFTTGIDYSTGKYGQAEETRIKYIPFIGKYELNRWLVKVTVPWIEIDGPGGVTGGDSNIIIAQNINKHSRESGLGDIVSSVTYTAFDSIEQKFILDAGAKVKFATASVEKGLGTGANDYSMQLDGYKTFDKFTLFSTVGYKLYGKPDLSNYSLSNVWFGTIGTAYRINALNSAGILLDLREAAWEQNTDIREYTLYYSHKYNSTYKLQSYITTGNTRSSVDFGAGLMLGVSW